MCPTRDRSFKWNLFHRLFGFGTKEDVGEEITEIAEVRCKKSPASKLHTVRDAFGPKYPHIVRLLPHASVDIRYNLWFNFHDEINWCKQYCDGRVDVRMFAHLPEQHNDWVPASGHTDKVENSVFFAFAREDEALIFTIKFKR